MHRRFKVLYITYVNTPLAIREEIALNQSQVHQLLRKITEFTNAEDVLVLSTCNRTEIYYSAEEDLSDRFIKLIEITLQKDLQAYRSLFKSILNGKAATTRLFEVSVGLESQVVGDLQIINQAKRAYQLSADEACAGPFLHRLMHTIFYANKRIVQETPFRDGAASSSYASVELAEQFASTLINPSVLLIGLGEIGRDVCSNLWDADTINPANVQVCNRTYTKALQAENDFGYQAIRMEELNQAVEKADIIISSVSTESPIVTADMVRRERGHQYLIDLSVPRSIDPVVDDLPGILVYNIDDLSAKADDVLEKRKASIPDVKAIISEGVQTLMSWSQEMEMSPTIHKLKGTLEQIRREEIARYEKNLSEDQQMQIEVITRSMMQKIIKLPVLQLKAACKRGEAESLVGILNDLFNLEQAEENALKKGK
jgi:glutamyl-tRNA reductase